MIPARLPGLPDPPGLPDLPGPPACLPWHVAIPNKKATISIDRRLVAVLQSVRCVPNG